MPTLAEQGIKGVEVVIWYGMLGPAGMPTETVQRYNTLVNEILRSPEVAEKMAKQSIVTVGGTVDELKQVHRRRCVEVAEDIEGRRHRAGVMSSPAIPRHGTAR